MIATARHNFCAAAYRFLTDARGTTAVLFAMIAVPVLGLGLAGLDYSRAYGTKSAIQNAADAAANAGAQMLGTPRSEVETAIRGYLQSNLPGSHRDLPFALTFAPDDRALTLKIDTRVRTSILSIVGVNALDVHAETTVERHIAPETIAPHRGVAPQIPEEIAKQLPGITPQQLKDAEVAARRILEALQNDGDAEVESLLRQLR